MSIDSLIEPPYFHDLEQRIAGRKSQKVVLSVLGLFSLVGGVWVSTLTADPINLFSIIFMALAFVNFGLIPAMSKSQRALEQKLSSSVAEQIAAERRKLMAIKEKMSDAEWENYKLQLQNQKLLVELNRKQNTKTQTTTTTTSWVAQTIED